MANENLSDEEYLDSLLEKVSGGDSQKSRKSISSMTDAEIDAEAERRVQEMMREGLTGTKPSTYKDVSIEQLIDEEKGDRESSDNLKPADRELLDSLDSIVQEIKGDVSSDDSGKSSDPDETSPKAKKAKKAKKTKAKKPKKEGNADKGGFGSKLKNAFFKVEIVDPVKEEEDEKKRKEAKEQAKARKAEAKEQDKAKKAEDKKAADALKKEEAQKRKAEKDKIREEKKAKKAELAAAREPEERVKLKPAFMLFLATVIAVLTLSVTLLSDSYSYSNSMNAAQQNFVNGRYKEAYENLAGMKIKEEDQMFYDQVRLLMRLERQYDAFVNYSNLQMPKDALNALLQGMTIYYEAVDYAAANNLTEKVDQEKEILLYSLLNNYGIDEEHVKRICELEDTNDYTREVELYSLNRLP